MLISRSRSAIFLLLATAAGCSSNQEPTPMRAVEGSFVLDTFAKLDVPSVVAQDAAGHTFSAAIAPSGEFHLDVPVGRTYRLFLTDLRASGRSSVESRILWPGGLRWAAVPVVDPGTTRDGGPIGVGTIGNIQGPPGGTTDGAGGGVIVGPPVGGGTTDGTPGAGGASSGSIGTSGAPGGGTGDGTSGSSGVGTTSGATADGNGGDGDGTPLCLPPAPTVLTCSGDPSKLVAAKLYDASVPTCVPSGGGSSGSSGASSGGVTPPPTTTPPPGAPQCEKDKVAVQTKKGWDCVKMETPVTYFYSDKPLTVQASVEFPDGVLTQWYPAVRESYPLVGKKDLTAPESKAKVCSNVMGMVGANNGLLDWGTLDVLPRGANVDAKLPTASFDRFTWSFARQVAANPVRAESGQLEKFLFYRGVGNFSLPVRVTSQQNGKVTLQNQLTDKIGAVFFLNVAEDGTKGAFTAAPAGIADKGALGGAIPTLAGAQDIETYADALAKSVRTALDADGLYDDEATAMVNTWKRQWFRTPGPRLLYIAPQSWTDASIPLHVSPAPESTTRVMVIRVELVTPELESRDTMALRGLATPGSSPGARAHFASLGRFAEPRLRRAIDLLGHPAYAQPLLDEVVETNHTKHESVATRPLTADPRGPKYPGKGFVVHEWGTDTIVVGSDGSQLLGLQHEEEDLPAFVYDRAKQ